MGIRAAKESDTEHIYRIVQETIDTVYPHYYPRGAVNFFKDLHSRDSILNDIKKDSVYVYETENKIVATVTIDRNEINRLFVLPEYEHKGIGTKLITFSEDNITQQFSIACLHASFAAKEMYLKRGYQHVTFHTKECDGGDFLCVDILSKFLEKPAV